ncbi:MAG TPA: 30S ribosomal protein S6 [bacterium]|nr:30S ribosomal protein S6 [bacterium]
MTNRTRTYECMCLLDNREVRKGWEPLKEAVAGLFTKHNAKVLSNRRWDERRLAYPIKGQNRATYLLVYFQSDTQALPGLRRDLEFSESMLRYMITECEDVPADAYEPEADFDVDAIPQDDAPDVEPAASEGEGEADGGKAEEAKEAEGAKEGEAKAEAPEASAAAAEGDAEPQAATDGGEENK